MNAMNDGGPAFPQPPCPDCGTRHASEHVPGISVRDYFAAKAMPALIAKLGHPEASAERAYAHADAMLKAREAQR